MCTRRRRRPCDEGEGGDNEGDGEEVVEEEDEVVEEEEDCAVLSAILSSSDCDKDTVPSSFNGCPCTSISSMGKMSSGGWGLNLWNGGRKERGRGERIKAAVPETKYNTNGTANPIDKP
jgi:hypothetical protein